MSIKQQKCFVCDEMHDVVMTAPQSKYLKICLNCYTNADMKGQKDYGFPEVRRDTGTHNPSK